MYSTAEKRQPIQFLLVFFLILAALSLVGHFAADAAHISPGSCWGCPLHKAREYHLSSGAHGSNLHGHAVLGAVFALDVDPVDLPMGEMTPDISFSWSLAPPLRPPKTL